MRCSKFYLGGLMALAMAFPSAMFFSSASRAQSLDITSLDITSLITQTAPFSISKYNRLVEGLWPEARARGISRATFDRAFAGVVPDPGVLRKAAKQPEFTTPPWHYINKRVSEKRIGNGLEKLAEFEGLLDRIEARYGVDRYVVVAIWGMESSYGFILDDRKIVKPVIQSLSTLAFYGRSKRRKKFGRKQLLAALQILEARDTTPDRMLGSWAGAMGHTQFIPTTYLAYAVDFDGDGRRDIWDNVADALGSTAHYLKKSGWKTGQTWGYEVKLPRGFNYGLTGRRNARTLAQWSTLGVGRVSAKTFPRPTDKAWLVTLAGARGPAFLMLKNFRSILRYNNATSYAVAVGHLADRLRGGGPFVQPWPEGDRLLGREKRKDLQRLLRARGFGISAIDGKIGPNTRKAIRAYQSRVGLVPDGFATKALLDRLLHSS
ncbi:Membrane-bound lytic murein transglycosylase B [hydrothermal vent metagenome]|uniref:Membrane-bound lytic murein transglycosylase B n=1 Tax=hydrothermal vent metagenome TaxID=652676 RepID=A0A3B0TFV4_9ZZZZ